jgi:hypothetical protein|tara:strand:+ start:7897 stop:8154 length:258 start_codon:yes stop_codon:yes gene_type:complete
MGLITYNNVFENISRVFLVFNMPPEFSGKFSTSLKILRKKPIYSKILQKYRKSFNFSKNLAVLYRNILKLTVVSGSLNVWRHKNV